MDRTIWDRTTGLVRAAASATRANPLLPISVVALIARQFAVAWSIAGSVRAPTPNSVLVVIALAIVVGTPAFAIASRHGRLATLLVLDLALGALMVAQLVYFRQFADLPTAESLTYATQGIEAGNVLPVLLRPSDALLFLGASFVGLLSPRLVRTAPLRCRTAACAALAGLVLFGAVLATSSMTTRARARRSSLAVRLGPIGYTLYDAGRVTARHLRRRFAVPSPEAIAADAATLSERHRRAPAPLRGAARGLNLIVVQLESFQAFTLETRIGGEPVTPTLHRLAKESIRFDAFHSQVSHGSTSDAELLVQCSLYPLRDGSVFFGYSTNDYRCLPEVLREAGYATAVFHANRANFWNRERIYPALGVERYFHVKSFQPDQPNGIVSDEAFFAQSLPLLEALPQPFHAMLVTLSSHGPFDAEFVPTELDHGAGADAYVARYLDHVRYTDRALGQFVEDLRRSGLLDRSVLIVYGDHHALGRRNSNIGEELGLGDDDAVRWFDTERRVPLLIRVPGGPRGAVVTKIGGQLDLAPTALALLGLGAEGTAFLGRDLLGEGNGAVILPSGTVATDDRLLVGEDGGFGRPGCYRRPGGERLPSVACADLEARAQAELALSTRMIELDVVARTAAAAPPTGGMSVSGVPRPGSVTLAR